MLKSIAACLAPGTTASALVEESITRATRPEAAGVYVLRRDESARQEAKIEDLRRALPRPPRYAGVPITIKDNVALAGLATTAGSKVLNAIAHADAPIVTRLRDAGFVILGRTNMSEFAYSGIGLNPHYGTPRNPAFKDDRVAGGSSSGAAVSVALGLAPVAIGTDTGGSVRIPAALCGLVGFKATRSAIPVEGIHPLALSLDSVGVLGRSVADCGAVFEVLRQGDLQIPRLPLDGLRIGVIENYVRENMDADVTRAVDAAVAKLARRTRIVPIRLPELDTLPDLFRKGSLVGAEAFAWHKDVIAGREHECDSKIVNRLTRGGTMLAADYVVLVRKRAVFQQAIAMRMAGLDALIAPTVPIIAPRVTDMDNEDAFHAANALVLRNTSAVNFLDGCAISLPCHAPGTPPVGLSLIGLHGQDDSLLRIAEAVEAELSA